MSLATGTIFWNCGHTTGNSWDRSSTPDQGVAACGGSRRRLPVGGAAKGIPWTTRYNAINNIIYALNLLISRL